MKVKNPTLLKALGLCGAATAALWRETIDWRAVYFNPRADTRHPKHSGRFVYLGWHEYMLMPILLRGSRRMLALASCHSDGEIVCRAMRHLGWSVTQGSSSRGGTAALLRLLRDDRRHINLTPDGPKGPRRTMALGAIFLASRLELPVVCVGYGFERPWRGRGWDQFAIPRPFSRCRAVFGPPLTVPPGLDRSELERYRGWFERQLNWLTDEAENWAADGQRRPGEVTMSPRDAARALASAPELSAPPLPSALAEGWKALNRGYEVAPAPVTPFRRARAGGSSALPTPDSSAATQCLARSPVLF
jgi:lysophospholipid acyltransferase (LPLAT)-like uncharacterized protein